MPMFTPNLVGLLSLLVAAGLPYLVGLLTRGSWSAKTKGAVLLGLAFVKTVLEAWIVALAQGVPFDFWAVLYSTGISFVIAVGSWFGLLRNTDLAEKAQKSLIKDPTLDPWRH